MSTADESRQPLDATRIAGLLAADGAAWPAPRIVASTGSTNDDVAALALAGAPEGAAVAAEEQTAGRGRRDRAWASPAGAGVWLSVLVRAGDRPKASWGLLSLAAGLAALDAVARAADVRAELKWPNDVVVPAVACGGPVGHRKLGGILSQTAGADGVVIGIGLNVSLRTEDLPVPDATSVLLEGGLLDRDALVAALIGALATRVAQWRDDPAALVSDYRGACRTIGRQVSAQLPDGSRLVGVVTGVDDDGHLLVDRTDGSGTAVVTAGDVVHASI